MREARPTSMNRRGASARRAAAGLLLLVALSGSTAACGSNTTHPHSGKPAATSPSTQHQPSTEQIAATIAKRYYRANTPAHRRAILRRFAAYAKKHHISVRAAALAAWRTEKQIHAQGS